MKAHGWLKEEFDKIEDSLEYKLADLEMDFTEKILKIMEERNISRTELAKKLNVSKAAISKLLNDGSNITLKRALGIAEVLDCEFSIELNDRKACNFSGEKSIHEKIVYNPHFDYESFYIDENRVSLSDDYPMKIEKRLCFG